MPQSVGIYLVNVARRSSLDLVMCVFCSVLIDDVIFAEDAKDLFLAFGIHGLSSVMSHVGIRQ